MGIRTNTLDIDALRASFGKMLIRISETYEMSSPPFCTMRLSLSTFDETISRSRLRSNPF